VSLFKIGELVLEIISNNKFQIWVRGIFNG
jgi:hypothetical protein